MTTAYTFDDLKSDVRKEAEALRKNATKEELGRLDMEKLDPHNADLCYYGLMTGSCGSPRAHELIAKCCVRLIDNAEFDTEVNSLKWAGGCQPKSAEELASVRIATDRTTSLKYISPIEAYIMLDEAKNANLIAFLRGETNDLDL